MKNNYLSLYLVTPEEDPTSHSFFNTLNRALQGGITALQFRNKSLPDSDYLTIAKKLSLLASQFNIPLILNDRHHLVKDASAQGVHLGQSDASPTLVRSILGPNSIIGLSVESTEQAANANAFPINYIAASPVFPTNSKLNTAPHLSPSGLKTISSISCHPTIAIGGISHNNSREVLNHGAQGLAIVSSIWFNTCPKSSVEKFKQTIINHDLSQ